MADTRYGPGSHVMRGDKANRPHTIRLCDDAHDNGDDRQARRAVAAENLSASLNARLSPDDPVWRFASQAATAMEGSLLPPEGRQRLLESARRLGVRRFEAGLVVALIQERARRGEIINSSDALLSMVSRSSRGRSICRCSPWVLWVSSCILAAALAAAILAWFVV